MAQHASWLTYSGSARIALAILLLIVAAAVVAAGTRLPRPFRFPRFGPNTLYLTVTVWVVVIFAFLAVVSDLAQQASHGHTGRAKLVGPVAPVTYSAVVVTFIVVLVLGRSSERPVRVAGAAIAALAAPMVFELPFDLIVMTRITGVTAGHLVAFFIPLFLIEIVTLALLTASPMVRLRRTTFFAFASILVVFAVWALFGFGFPDNPLNFSLNVVSKLLAFATTLTLFLPVRPSSEAAPGPSAQPVELGEGAELFPLPGQVRDGRADDHPGDPVGG